MVGTSLLKKNCLIDRIELVEVNLALCKCAYSFFFVRILIFWLCCNFYCGVCNFYCKCVLGWADIRNDAWFCFGSQEIPVLVLRFLFFGYYEQCR